MDPVEIIGVILGGWCFLSLFANERQRRVEIVRHEIATAKPAKEEAPPEPKPAPAAKKAASPPKPAPNNKPPQPDKPKR
jgi:hypothetical protein